MRIWSESEEVFDFELLKDTFGIVLYVLKERKKKMSNENTVILVQISQDAQWNNVSKDFISKQITESERFKFCLLETYLKDKYK